MAPKNNSLSLPENIVGLPVAVATPSDIGRMLRELETVDSLLLQQSLGGKVAAAPKLSSLLEKTVAANKLDITDANNRKRLQAFLALVRKSAPVLHMSFSADPTVPFMEQLLAYLRREIHPLILVSVGLQPNLGAGCVVRSTNKYFDMSLRKNFENSKTILVDKLADIRKVANTPTIQTATPAPPPAPALQKAAA